MNLTLKQITLVLVRLAALGYFVSSLRHLMLLPNMFQYVTARYPVYSLDFWMLCLYAAMELIVGFYWIVRCDVVAKYVTSGLDNNNFPVPVNLGVICAKIVALEYIIYGVLDLYPFPGHVVAYTLGAPKYSQSTAINSMRALAIDTIVVVCFSAFLFFRAVPLAKWAAKFVQIEHDEVNDSWPPAPGPPTVSSEQSI